MVIFFLQVEGVLHTLAALQSVPGLEEVLENDFNFSFCTDSSRLPRLPASKHLGLAELLRKFFRFFADFNFNAASVCLRHGVPAERPVGKVSCSEKYQFQSRAQRELPNQLDLSSIDHEKWFLYLSRNTRLIREILVFVSKYEIEGKNFPSSQASKILRFPLELGRDHII